MCLPGKCKCHLSCQVWLCHWQYPSFLLWLVTTVMSLSIFLSFPRHGISSYMAYISSCKVFTSLLHEKISNNLFQTIDTLGLQRWSEKKRSFPFVGAACFLSPVRRKLHFTHLHFVWQRIIRFYLAFIFLLYHLLQNLIEIFWDKNAFRYRKQNLYTLSASSPASVFLIA